MTTNKPFLARFSQTPRRPGPENQAYPREHTDITPNPRPTIVTEVQNETTDDN